jgi:hypothetical protein
MSRVVALTGLPGSPVPATIGMTWIRDGPGGIPASDKEMPQRFHRRDAGPGQGFHVSHLPDTTRLFARMLLMEVTVSLQVRALRAPTTCITDVLGAHIALSPTDLTRT